MVEYVFTFNYLITSVICRTQFGKYYSIQLFQWKRYKSQRFIRSISFLLLLVCVS